MRVSHTCVLEGLRLHQHVAQCCGNIQPSFSKCLGIQKVCLGFERIHKNVNKKYFKNLKTIGYIDPRPAQCWSSVADDGPTSVQCMVVLVIEHPA